MWRCLLRSSLKHGPDANPRLSVSSANLNVNLWFLFPYLQGVSEPVTQQVKSKHQ